MIPSAHGLQCGDKVRLVRSPEGYQDPHTPVGEIVRVWKDMDGVRRYDVRFLNRVARGVTEGDLAPAWTEQS